MITARTLSLLAPTLALTSLASAGLSDMYVTNDRGELYFVDGNTLQATSVGQLSNSEFVNDILYVGDGKIIANMTFALVSYDLNTGVQDTILYASDLPNEVPALMHTWGLARTNNGELYFGVTALANSPEETSYYGTTYDPSTGTTVQNAHVPHIASTDYYELGNGNMLEINDPTDSLVEFDPHTGSIVRELTNGVTAVSFIQSHDSLFLLTAWGRLHEIDLSDGSLSFYGQISGYEYYIMGGSIADPTARLVPSIPTVTTMSGLLCLGLRRRR
jgi:hypothetical protein